MTVVNITRARELYKTTIIFLFRMRKYHTKDPKKGLRTVIILAVLTFGLLASPSNFTGKAMKLKNESFMDLLQATQKGNTLTSNIINDTSCGICPSLKYKKTKLGHFRH